MKTITSFGSLAILLIALALNASLVLADGNGGYDVLVTKVSDVSEVCSPLYTFTGEAADDAFGWSVEGAGDVDGDGFDDVIVGAPRSDAAGPQSGRAYVYSGQSGSLLYDITGENSGDHFGGLARSLGSTGDINGDGYVDLIFGARFNDAAGSNAGRVYVFLGGPGPYPITLSASDADLIVSGESSGDRLGYSVSIVGDINSDGYDDVCTGATQDYGGGSAVGKAYIFLGGPGPYPINISASSADVIMLGEGGGHFFGTSVSGLGDVNSDSFDDFIVGAPGSSTSGFNGRSYAFFGGGGGYPAVVSAASADMVLIGEAGGDHFGASVSSAGDVNNDGFDDIFVGATYNDAGGVDAGRAYVFLGSSGPYPTVTGAGVADMIITGESSYDWLGCAVSGASDVNCDGHLDLLIGSAPWDYASQGSHGRAYLFLGTSGSYPRYINALDADATFDGEAAGDLFGTTVSSAGDVSGDGCADLIIGAPKNDAGGADAGRVYVYDCIDMGPLTQYVAFDIKPGSCPNPLNTRVGNNYAIDINSDMENTQFAKANPGTPRKKSPVLPGAILGTMDFDVNDIDPSTIVLEGVPVLRWNFEDVATPIGPDAEECECNDYGPDGYMDLSLKFSRVQIILALGEVYDGDVIPLTISGELIDGSQFEGTDCVVIIAEAEEPAYASSSSPFGLANYPNPFNPTTDISFSLPSDSYVKLEIYNIMGQRISTLVDDYKQAGSHTVSWNGRDNSGTSVASGVYFYRIQAGEYSDCRKMMLLK